MMNKYMDTDFLETQGRFSINPQQVTNVEYYENALYFYFNGAENSSMRIKFDCEENARISLEGFKTAIIKKQLDEVE